MKGTKKLLFSVVALVITLAMSVTATYAWFTTNIYATVEGFNVQVTTAEEEGLFVRLVELGDNEPYAMSISETKVLNAIKSNNGGNEPFLKPLTTNDGKTLQEPTKVIAGNTTFGSEDLGPAPNGSWAKFTLQFGSINPGAIVLVGKVGTETVSEIKGGTDSNPTKRTMKAWDFGEVGSGITKEDLGYGTADYEKDDPIVLRAFNAARVSFVSGTGESERVNVWAPNAIRDQIQVGYYDYYFDWEVGLPEDYKEDGVANQITVLQAPETEGTPLETEGVTILCVLEEAPEGSTFEYVGTVTVWVWLDGNDGSAINNIAGDIFNIAMQFRRIDDTPVS